MANYNTTTGNHTFDDEVRVDEIKDNAGTGAPDVPNGITFSGGSDALTAYEEGTWTPTESGKANMTGTGTFNGASYTRVGRQVFVMIDTITGYSVTTGSNVAATGDKTQLGISLTGLPVAASNRKFGCAAVEAGSNFLITGVIIGTSTITIQWDSASSGAVGISNIWFTYQV